MWGIVPAAGRGSRIQPLAFSKELLPVGSRPDGDRDRPRAVAEYLVERMACAGVDKICFVIGPGKSDILDYFGDSFGPVQFAYVVQPRPAGLCDAVFRAATVIADRENVIVGLPDTIWFPNDALRALPDSGLSFLLFPVEHPEFFDAVVLDDDRVLEIEVKQANARSKWIWGAFKMSGDCFRDLHSLWKQRDRIDEYFGTLVNSYLNAGGSGIGIKAGQSYVDVGTLAGYRAAIQLLAGAGASATDPRTTPASPEMDSAGVAAMPGGR